MCICVRLFMLMWLQCLWRSEEGVKPLEAEVTVSCDYLTGVLGIQFRSSARAVWVLNCLAVSPVTCANLKKKANEGDEDVQITCMIASLIIIF